MSVNPRDFIDRSKQSNCCGAPMIGDICSDCKEHCEADPQCPGCGSFDINKRHHQPTFAVPECHYMECDECKHQWDHQ